MGGVMKKDTANQLGWTSKWTSVESYGTAVERMSN